MVHVSLAVAPPSLCLELQYLIFHLAAEINLLPRPGPEVLIDDGDENRKLLVRVGQFLATQAYDNKSGRCVGGNDAFGVLFTSVVSTPLDMTKPRLSTNVRSTCFYAVVDPKCRHWALAYGEPPFGCRIYVVCA